MLATQPYPAIHGGSFRGPSVSASPDPLVAYRWDREHLQSDGLQVYTRRPLIVSTPTPDSFGNLSSLTEEHPDVEVKGTGVLQMDFGSESAGWLEFDSRDWAGLVEMSISEYNEPCVVNSGPAHPAKTAVPQRRGNTFRLELNAELYEGVRFGWITVRTFERPWHLNGVRLVCQAKPVNYEGSFSSSDRLLDQIWYDAVYTVRLNLKRDHFGAILIDRGDRHSWTGDAHPAQAASMIAFGNFEFVRKNLEVTADQTNGIESFSLYWVLSLLEYYLHSGDRVTLDRFIPNAQAKLDHALAVYGTNPSLGFFGWDERLGAGFENPDCRESQNAYKMLAIRAWREFASVMNSCGRGDLGERYCRVADEKVGELRLSGSWFEDFGLHAGADAINAGFINEREQAAIAARLFGDRVNRLSLSPFNQYFVVQAMAAIGDYDAALGTIRDLWGGQHNYGGTTSFETFRPSWVQALGENDPVPNNQAGYTSLCHPWGAGVVRWLSEETLGVRPTSPGYTTFDAAPRLGKTLTRVSGRVATPHGVISATFDLTVGAAKLDIPAGTVGRVGIPKAERWIRSVSVNGIPAWNGRFLQSWVGSTDSSHVFFDAVPPGTYDFLIEYAGPTAAHYEPDWVYPAKWGPTDNTTSGHWGGTYGSDGYVLLGQGAEGADMANLPLYIKSVAFTKVGRLLWSDHTMDPRAPAADRCNGGPRKAACIHTRDPIACQQTMTVDIQTELHAPYSVALYFLDWDRRGRRLAVEMFDLDTLEMVTPVRLVPNFAGGTYLVYSYHRPARFRIDQVRGPNATMSGIFFGDPG